LPVPGVQIVAHERKVLRPEEKKNEKRLVKEVPATGYEKY